MKKTFTLIAASLMIYSLMGQTSFKNISSHQKVRGISVFENRRHESLANEKYRPANFKVKSQDFLKSAQLVKQRLDSMNYEDYDTINNQWISSEKDEYLFDVNGNLTHEIYYNWDITSSSWVGNWKYEYTYNTMGNRDHQAEYSWDTDLKQWIGDYKTDYAYDSNNNVLEEIQYYWDEDLNQWDISSTNKHDYIYDNKGNITQDIVQSLYSGTDQWFYNGKYQYTYNAFGFQTLELYFHWDMILNDWANSYKYENYEDMTQSIESSWDENSNQWANSYKYAYSYNSDGDMVEEIEYEWDELTNQWIGNWKDDYSFDNSYAFNELILPFEDIESYFNHMITSGSSYQWDDTINQWVTSYRFVLHYSETNISNTPEISLPTLKTFPNPATDFVIFDLTDASKPAIVELYDVQGKKLISQLLSVDKRISVGQFKNGLFFYTLNQNGNIYNGKIVIKKD